MSDFQILKLSIIDTLGLGRDSLHLYVGFLCLFAAVLLWKDKRSLWVLAPGLIVSLLLEGIDLHDDMVWFGYYRWAASFHDIVNTNVLPTLTVLIFRQYLPKKDQ